MKKIAVISALFLVFAVFAGADQAFAQSAGYGGSGHSRPGAHRSGGGGGNGGSLPTPSDTGVTTGGQVLGAEAYNFTVDLHYGSTGQDVTELQKILIADGYLKIDAPTGWFGPLTQAAVKLYQAAHGIPATGYVGPLTRGALNTGSTPTTPETTTTTSTTTTTTTSAPSSY